MRRFLWNNSPHKSHQPLVSWKLVCQPSSLGGLGIKWLKLLNQAWMLKLAWRLLKEPQSLWVQVFKAKYFPNTNLFHTKAHLHSSWVWKNIHRSIPLMQQNLIWEVGNGQDILVWNDFWVGYFKLKDYLLSNIPHGLLNIKVSDLINLTTWSWNLVTISPFLSSDLLHKILAIPLPLNACPDQCHWRHTYNGIFSIKYAYNYLLSSRQQVPLPSLPWHNLWKIRVQPKVKFFLWLLCHDKLPTRLLLYGDRKSTRLNSSHEIPSRMPSSA